MDTKDVAEAVMIAQKDMSLGFENNGSWEKYHRHMERFVDSPVERIDRWLAWRATAEWRREPTPAFSRGWHRGNYGNAYESQDWESWCADQMFPAELATQGGEADWQAGLLLGFFASHELDEIGDELLSEEVFYLRLWWGSDC